MSEPSGSRESRWPVLRFGRQELTIGPKVWIGVLIAAVIVLLGIFASPNVGTGLAIGGAGVLGAILGALFQSTPIPKDFTAEGASAVRGLVRVAEDVENASTATAQLVEAANDPVRVRIGLVSVQDRLLAVRQSVYVAMSEWDAVAPGSLDEVRSLRERGLEALRRLSQEDEAHE